MLDKKLLNIKRPLRKRIAFASFGGGLNTQTDQNLLPFKYSPHTFNFNVKSGALTDGTGIGNAQFTAHSTPLEPPSPPVKIYFYKRYDGDKADDRLIAYCGDKKVYSLRLGVNDEFSEIEGLIFENAPVAVNYRYNGNDVLILSCEKDNMVILDGDGYTSYDNTPYITSMCVHYERLFVTSGEEKSMLYFSKDFDPVNFNVSLDEAGFIDMPDMRGTLIKVVSFLDYVYIFRTNGIARLVAYANQEEFSCVQLFVTSGRIFKDTITTCGDRIIFLAEDGLYIFDGIYTRKLLTQIESLFKNVDNKNAAAEYINGKYYLAFNIIKDGEEQTSLMEYDINDGSFLLTSGLDVIDMEPVNTDLQSKLIFLLDGSGVIGELCCESRLFDTPLNKIWQSPATDFGIKEKNKVLKEISLMTDGDIEIETFSDSGKKRYKIKGKKTLSVIRPNLRGKIFWFTIKSNGINSRISNLAVIADGIK